MSLMHARTLFRNTVWSLGTRLLYICTYSVVRHMRRKVPWSLLTKSRFEFQLLIQGKEEGRVQNPEVGLHCITRAQKLWAINAFHKLISIRPVGAMFFKPLLGQLYQTFLILSSQVGLCIVIHVMNVKLKPIALWAKYIRHQQQTDENIGLFL